MNMNQTTEDRLKQLIENVVEKRKPENTKQLITIVTHITAVSEEDLSNTLIQLESEGMFIFNKKPTTFPSTVEAYFFSKKAAWYWIIIALAITSTVFVFTIPDESQLLFLRSALGIIFILFLPGYSLVKLLYIEKVPIKTSSENLGNIERFALSFGLSLVITSLLCLVFNFTPWGIRLIPVVFGILSLTIVFCTAALMRIYQAGKT
jgi:hypothetical protein